MRVTAEDLQRQYGEMGDEELLSLHPGDLNPLARQVYEAELGRRALAPDAPEGAAPAAAGGAPSDLVPVATYVSAQAAGTARTTLDEAGCQYVLEEVPDGVRLLVPAPYEMGARELLSKLPQMSVDLVEEWLQETLRGHRVVIEDLLAEDDLVAARLTIDGKRQAFCFARIADGQVAETWHNFD